MDRLMFIVLFVICTTVVFELSVRVMTTLTSKEAQNTLIAEKIQLYISADNLI